MTVIVGGVAVHLNLNLYGSRSLFLLDEGSGPTKIKTSLLSPGIRIQGLERDCSMSYQHMPPTYFSSVELKTKKTASLQSKVPLNKLLALDISIRTVWTFVLVNNVFVMNKKHPDQERNALFNEVGNRQIELSCGNNVCTPNAGH